MAKVNITKPTGNIESLTLLSAFKADNNQWVIFDSEKVGSMGLPIIYVSKYTNKLEKINDPNEWQSAKNYLKGIINGANFEFIRIDENLTSDETYYTPLTLPVASFDTIKSRYVVNTIEETPNVAPVMPTVEALSNEVVNTTPIEPIPPVVPSIEPINPIESVVPTTPVVEPINIEPAAPVIPTIQPIVEPTIVTNPTTVETNTNINFDTDKETFLKACENMFDALVSKYQKQIEILNQKEQELNEKLNSAKEHLANAEAREQVANIAHDNAQKVMDLSSVLPHPTNQTTTGVI